MLTIKEQMILAQALYKRLGEAVSTSNEGNLRDAFNSSYRDLYEVTGAKSYDMLFQGEKVGTFAFNHQKAKEAYEEEELRVNDYAEFVSWLKKLDPEELVTYIPATKYSEIAIKHLTEDGEIPEGAEFETVHYPPVKEGISGNGVFKINEDKVFELVKQNGLSEAAVAALLPMG